MTYFEFLYGLRKKSIKNKEKYDLSLTDLFIASQVMETNGILVTKDRDFKKIEEIEKIVLE